MRISVVQSPKKQQMYLDDDRYRRLDVNKKESVQNHLLRSRVSPIFITVAIMLAAGCFTLFLVFVFLNAATAKEARKRQSDLDLQQIESSGDRAIDISSTELPQDLELSTLALLTSAHKSTTDSSGNTNRPSTTQKTNAPTQKNAVHHTTSANTPTSPPSNQFYITSTTSHVTNKTQTHRVTDRNGALLTEVSESKTLHEQKSVKQAIRLSEPVNIPGLTSALQKKQQQTTHSVKKSTTTTAKPRIIVKTTTKKPIIRITPSRNQKQVVAKQPPVQQKQNCPSVCYSDKDCGKGQCLGSNLGKCSCSHCVSMLACKSDADCGGLRGACENSVCKCAQALMKHGYLFYIDAIRSFCNRKSCSKDKDDCFGLPCSVGRCKC